MQQATADYLRGHTAGAAADAVHVREA